MFARTPARDPSSATCRLKPRAGLDLLVRGNAGPRSQTCDRRDEHDRPAFGHSRQGRATHQEVGAHVDGENGVPFGHRRSLEAATFADPDVADEAVDSAERADRLFDHTCARAFVGHVSHDHRGCAARLLDQLRRLPGRVGIPIDAGDRGALPCREHGHRAAVADRRVRVTDDRRVPAPITTTRRPARRSGITPRPSREARPDCARALCRHSRW